MRDHGDLWGRAWRVVDRSATAVRLVFDDPAGRYRFWRTATITSSGLALRYAVENRTSADLPFLWSMHPILSVKPGDQILLPGIARVRATFLRHPKLKEASVLPWPEAQGLENEPVRLDLIGPWDGVTSAKLYAGPMPQSATGVVGSDGWLLFEADTSVAAFVGMYLNYGGWPEPGSRLHQIGLELTTAPVDDLAAAVAGGYHRVVPPLGRLDWSAAVLVGLRKDAIPAWMTTTTT